MFTRDTLHSGSYFDHFDAMPDLWTPAQIESSLVETMRRRPANATGIWLFAYGSLMWNPLVNVSERRIATLNNWHRTFSLRITVGRGCAETPGRMLALEPSGYTEGVALRVAEADAFDELRIVWVREMVLGSYIPIWAPVTLDDGTQVDAITFVVDPCRAQFETDSSVATVAPLIRTAWGSFGTNAEYLNQLAQALRECGLHDAYVESIFDEIERLNDVEARAAACAAETTPSSDD